MTTPQNADRFRNLLAFLLIGAFIVIMPLIIFKDVPAANRDIFVYAVGQLSGMAATCLAFYFTQKAGQEALDTKRAESQGKLADAVVAAVNSPGPTPPPDPNAPPQPVTIRQDPDNPVPVDEVKT